MTTTFDHRVALEDAIGSCSESVRVLREKMHKKNEAVEMEEDLAKEVQRLMGLRKELQSWTQNEEADKADNQQEVETPEAEADDDELVVADKQLEQRAIELESRVAKANDKLTMLEMEVTQIERTKKALKYLKEHKTIKMTEVETVAQLTTEEIVKKGLKKNKKKTKKVKKEKIMKSEVMKTAGNTDEAVKLTMQLEVERMKVLEATQTVKKLQKPVNVLTEEKSKAAAKLTVELQAERTKAEQARQTNRAAWKAEQGLRDAQDKLEQKIATITQEKTELVATLTAGLKRERSKLEHFRQSGQKVAFEQANALETLANEKIELTKALQAAENTTRAIRDELAKLQNELSEIKDDKETRETHLGKLWKNIEDLQLANKKLKEKNVLIKADAKIMRAAAEKSIAELSSYDNKTSMLTAEMESAEAALQMSKNEVERLQSDVSVSKLEVAHFEERIRTLERELKVAKVTALESSSERDHLSKLNIEAKEKSALSNERIQILEKEIQTSKQIGLELVAECDALRKSTKEAEFLHAKTIKKLTFQNAQLQSATEGKCGKHAAELKTAHEVALISNADKEELTRQLLEIKDNVVQLTLKNKKVRSQVSEKDLQLKKIAVDLETRTAEGKKLKVLYENLVVEQTNAANKLQDLRGVAATNEEMLKKARAFLLEANEELKEARANALKWKNSAQAAKTLMNAKIADFESASRQLKKARADASSAGTARSQLTLSLQAKEKRLAMTKQELVAIRTEFTKAVAAMEDERTQLQQEHTAYIARLCEVSDHEVALLNSQVQSYRVMLAILLLFVAVSVYAVLQ